MVKHSQENEPEKVAMGHLRTLMYNIMGTVSSIKGITSMSIPPLSINKGLRPDYVARNMLNNIILWCIANDTGDLKTIKIVCFKDMEEYQPFM
jgi:hypothetical protein